MIQSGLHNSWWGEAMECYVFPMIIQDLLGDGKTLYEWRFDTFFKTFDTV